MTRIEAKAFAKLLFEIIRFTQKHGGNRDTYILNKLTECRDILLKEYPNDGLEKSLFSEKL